MTTTPAIRPLGSRILVRRLPAETRSEGGVIYIPDNARELSQKVAILTLGTGGTDPDGKPFEFTVTPGDVALIGKYVGAKVAADDDDHILIYERDILGIFDKETALVDQARQMGLSLFDAIAKAAAESTLERKPRLALSDSWIEWIDSCTPEAYQAFSGKAEGRFVSLFDFEVTFDLQVSNEDEFKLIP